MSTTHLTPLESCQKVSKNVTNVTGDMISGKYAQTCRVYNLHALCTEGFQP